MRAPFPALLLALAAGLAGCASMAPPYQRPVAPVPAAWPAAPAEAGTLPAETGWREFFIDERLRELVALTLANNRDLRIATLNIEKARALYRVQRAERLPTLNAAGSASRQRTPAGLSESGQARTSGQYSVELGLASFELDFFGRVRSLSDAALQSFLATEESRHSTQLSLVSEVAGAWLTLAADTEALALAEQTLSSQQASYDLALKRQALGAESGLTVAQAQTTVDAARVQAAGFRRQVAQDRNALALLVGTSVPVALLPDGVTQAAPLVEVPAGLPSSVLQRRPDVLAAEHSLEAANADIGAARAAFFPRISLTAAAGTASGSLGGLFEGGSGAWSFLPSISLPIFDGGANRANLQGAEADRDIALATYEKTLQTAFREVADALAARANLGEELAAQASLVAATDKSLQLAQARFRSGADSYLEVLDAQRSLYAAQQSLITLRLADQSNRLALYKVLGGGGQE